MRRVPFKFGGAEFANGVGASIQFRRMLSRCFTVLNSFIYMSYDSKFGFIRVCARIGQAGVEVDGLGELAIEREGLSDVFGGGEAHGAKFVAVGEEIDRGGDEGFAVGGGGAAGFSFSDQRLGA